jgi:hypothetical protein
VNNILGKFLPAGEWSITPAPSIQTDTNGVNWLTVSIQANNYFIILDKLIPAFDTTGNPYLQVKAAYTMRME